MARLSHPFLLLCERVSELFFDIVLVAFRRVPGDHLADEAGQEQHDAQNYGEERQVEQGLVRHRAEMHSSALVYQFRCNQYDGEDEARKEHQDSSESEEVHRLLSECAEEP